jgi:hypothetical protein
MVGWLDMVKMTFTLDDDTVARLRRVAGGGSAHGAMR